MNNLLMRMYFDNNDSLIITWLKKSHATIKHLIFVNLENIKPVYNIKKCKSFFTLFSVFSIKKMSNLSKEEILMKFNSMGGKLINARYHHISLIKKKKKKKMIMGKILKQNLSIPIEDIDFKLINVKKYIVLSKSNLVNKEIAYYF